MTYNSIVLADSPKNYVTFDQSGTLTDSGSQNNTLVTTNAGTKTAPGIGGSGNYMMFNGTSNTIGITNGYDFAAGTAWSIEAWFLTSDTTATKEIIRRDGNGRAYLLRIAGQNIEWYCNISGSEILTSGTNYADGKWHHVVGTYSSGTMKLYIDGTQYGTTGTGNAGTQTTTATTYIGSSGGTSEFFNGNLDEVAVYSVALTSTQVTTHYNAGIVNVTTTPPAMNFGTNALSMATPRVGPADVTVSAPAATLSLATATPVVTAGTGFTATPPAATMSLSSPNAKALISVTVAETSDSAGGGTIAVNTGTSTSSSGTYVNFTTPTIPTGKVLASAQLEWQFVNFTTGYTLHFGQKTNTSTPAAMTNTHNFTVGTGLFSNQYYSVDITDIVNNWIGGATNDGIGISKESTGGSGTVSLVGGTGSQGPKIVYNYTDAPPPVIVTPPAMTLSLDMATAPVVSETSNVTALPPAMTLTLSFPGGITANPDFTLPAPVMTMSMTAPVPDIEIRYPVTVTPPPMTLSLDTPSGVTIDLTTNVLKIAPAMTMSMLMVGLFDAAHDRYFAKVTGTVDADDIWYKMDETSGNRALDSVYGDSVSSTNWTQSGYYWGTPTFGTIGEQLRKAVTFNGSTDYLTVGPYAIDNKYASVGLANDVTPGMAATIEFSIRTSQTDGGVVFAATGAQPQSVAAGSPSSSITALPVLNGCKVTVEAGQLVIHDGTNSAKVRKFIADGQWHHVVMAIPAVGVNADLMGGPTPHYVQIDGKTIYARYGAFTSGAGARETGETWLPYSFMAESQPFANLGTGAPLQSTNTINYLAGDLSNVIVRLNNYVLPDLAESLYYEWSDAEVVNPPPMTLSLTMVNPFSAKGSVKKMLAIYGLAWGHEADSPQYPLRTYMSSLSGLVIDNLAHTIHGTKVPAVGGGEMTYPKPVPFFLNGYLVVPVSIYGDSTINGPSSADGVLNPDAPTMDGRFVDDETGLYRFINLQTDLAQNLTDEYDIVTVVNYPWEHAENTNGFYLNPSQQFAQPIPVHGLKMAFTDDSKWQRARDAFRDSLLEAAYDGANLWIGEYEMAYHLGFIQGYDMHDAGHWGVNVYNNKRGWDLDDANLRSGQLNSYPYTGADRLSQQTGYFTYPQANWRRRIVTLIPGITDIPGDEWGDWVEGWNGDDYFPNGNFIAYNILRRPTGLQLGDQTVMHAVYKGSKYFGETSGSFPELNPLDHAPVISAHPDGIAGTVVAREQESYYGPDGVIIDNPYKDNAITIAAEVGTVVRGRPIAGRAFIELMDTQVGYYGIAEDTNKLLWGGNIPVDKSTGLPVQNSFWDMDTRRSKEIKVTITSYKFKFDPNAGTFVQESTTWSYFQYFPIPEVGNTAISMHARGLYWLGQTPELNPGDARVFATAMNLSLTTPAPSLSSVSSPATQVIGPMRLGLQMVKPANFADGNVEVDIFGTMDMLLDMHGLGRVVSVPPMSLTLTTPNPTLDVAADLVTVYLDADRNITVFLKEDN